MSARIRESAHSIDSIKTLLTARYGAKKFRVFSTGAIFVHTIQVNEDRPRWLLFGDIGAADTEARLDALAAEYGEKEAA